MITHCRLEDLVIKSPIVFDNTALGGACYLDSKRVCFIDLLIENKYDNAFILSEFDFFKSDKDSPYFLKRFEESFKQNNLFVVESGYECIREKGKNISVEDALIADGQITTKEAFVLQEARKKRLHPGSVAALRIALYLSRNGEFELIPILSQKYRQFPISVLNREEYGSIFCLHPGKLNKVGSRIFQEKRYA